MTKRVFFLACGACAALTLVVFPVRAVAEMWCAYPIWVHEWGVQVFGADGRAAAPVGLPGYFHGRGPSSPRSGSPVRQLPPDGGERELPVVHFYSASGTLPSPIPVAVEVGFARGTARRWFPQVDTLRSAASANSARARAARAALERQRKALTPFGSRPTLPADPTRQLEWSRLSISSQAVRPPPPAKTPWVKRLRGFDRALWVNGATESERFLFYEADTSEQVPLEIQRGPHYRAGKRHYVLRNRGSHALHDVFVIHRDDSGAHYVYYAPGIPPGATNGFVLESQAVAANRLLVATRQRLRQRLVDTAVPAPPAEYSWAGDNCVMGRDPAVPVERSEGHRLYAHEVDAILEIWGGAFFDRPGTTIVFREDTAYLDAMMPLSIYTDMYHFVLLRRTGLGLWQNVSLP